jgi:hypothetical protein
METIIYQPEIKVQNLASLSVCKGAKYLECIRAHTGELVAKQWRRVKPDSYDVLIEFKAKPAKTKVLTSVDVRAMLHNARYDLATGRSVAEALSGEIVSRRQDINGVDMITYRIPYDGNCRGELLYTYRNGPMGYEWSIV